MQTAISLRVVAFAVLRYFDLRALFFICRGLFLGEIELSGNLLQFELRHIDVSDDPV